MHIKIENHAENTTRIIDYPADIRTFLAAHSFGVYNVARVKTGVYAFYDRFTGELATTVSKPGKREIAAFLKGDKENGN